jgi:hypothetical protein
MVDRPYNVWKTKDSFRDSVIFGYTTLTVGDTITFSQYDTTSTIWSVSLHRFSNGQDVTCTTALNVATVTQAGLLNEKCYFTAHGLKA